MSKKTYIKQILIFLCTVIVLVFLDQVTKLLAVQNLQNNNDIILIPHVLELHYLENTGAAFSLLSEKMIVFYILTPILCILVLYCYYRIPFEKKHFILHTVLAFLFAGAIGNFVDRILYQYVIDFIYFSLINFPIFNVADIYVTCSVFVLFILILFYYSEEDLTQITNSLKRKKKES